ncbi:MAG: DNA translocase FtsK 4TM domain-containing protein [Robiginitomaculum sp.]
MLPPAQMTREYHNDYNREDYDKALLDENISAPSALKRALWAFFVAGVGLIITVAILTFSPFDNTADTASSAPTIHNFLGRPSASLANFLLQFIGWAAFPLGALMIFAAARAVLIPRLSATRLDTVRRSGLLVSSIIFLSMFLAAFPVPQSWPMATSIGGWFGDGVFACLKGLFLAVNAPNKVAGALTAFLAFCGLGYSIGRFLGMVERDVVLLLDATGLVWATFRVRLDQFILFLKRKFQKDYIDPMERAEIDNAHTWVEGSAAQVQPEYEPEHYDEAPYDEAIASAPVPNAVCEANAKPASTPRKTIKGGKFVLPKVNLLNIPPPRIAVTDAGALQKSAEQLGVVLEDFGVKGDIGAVRPGPVVTLYEFEPAPGVKSSRIINLADDIARSMAARSARVAVVPGRNAIGIELPNRRRKTVYLRDMLASRAFKDCGHKLPLALGEDIGGKPFFADLAKMPHMLVAGTTGSGKSVGINSFILSLMYTLSPNLCKFIMIDPKMLELSVYDGVPHLLTPVVTNPKKAVVALKWAVQEMESRYKNMAKIGVRSIAGYNDKVTAAQKAGEQLSRTVMTGYDKATGEPMYETEMLEFEFMPFIVIIIDEMADLMMVAGKDIEGTVQRLAQMARAAGIHMIMATQRPSVDVITGTIKANFPTRISFSVSSKIDSRTILGEQGGEQLLGMGDMLFMLGGRKPHRLHGPFVSDDEVEKIANFIKAQGAPTYLEDIIVDKEEEAEAGGPASKTGDETFDKAVDIVATTRKCSTSYIQRRLSIGYNRAANIVERMEAEDMIGPAGAGGKREIFLPEIEAF